MIYIYNRDEEQIDILDIKPKFAREIGKFNTLEFETIKEYEKGYRVVYQYKGKSYEFIIQEQDYLRDDMVSFSYFCKDSFVENAGVPILDKRPEGSYKVALNSVLEDTRWELIAGSDFSETLTFFNSFYQVSVLEAFAEIVDKYNLEWETSFAFTGSKITSRKIHIKKIGKQANSRLEFGKNIVKFERKILPENIVTALYGYGKGEETESGGFSRRISFADINGGLAYVTNEEARQKYGIGPVGAKKHIFGFFIDEEETDKTKLLEATKKELERVSQSQAEYTIEAVNLHIDCDYADTVPVLDEEINFSGETRIVKAIVEGDDLVFVFGHVVKGFTDSFTKEIQKSAEATEIKITSIMETRLNQIADIYFGEDGYNYDLKVGNEYNLPAGLYSFDAPIDESPTKVIYFGAGKLLIADSKATDGGWAWKTALDGQGIVGSSIVAHSITANKLASDVGQSLDLSSNVSITQTSAEISSIATRTSSLEGSTETLKTDYTKISQDYQNIKLTVDTKGKYRNIIPNSNYFVLNGIIVPSVGWVATNTSGDLYFTKQTGTNSLIAYIPIESTVSVATYTLWIGRLTLIGVTNARVALIDESGVTVTDTGTLKEGITKLTKLTGKEKVRAAALRVQADSSVTGSQVRIVKENITLVEGDITNLTWDMTYLTSGGTIFELTKTDILAQVGNTYLKLEDIGKITLSGNQIILDGTTTVKGDFKIGSTNIAEIAGWTVTSQYLVAGSGSTYFQMSPNYNNRILIGGENYDAAKFAVRYDGKVKMENATIIGGYIAGLNSSWNLEEGRIWTEYGDKTIQLSEGSLWGFSGVSKRLEVSQDGMYLWHETSGKPVGSFKLRRTNYSSDNILNKVSVAHGYNAYMGISYETGTGLEDYVTFDGLGYAGWAFPITVQKQTNFGANVRFSFGTEFLQRPNFTVGTTSTGYHFPGTTYHLEVLTIGGVTGVALVNSNNYGLLANASGIYYSGPNGLKKVTTE